MILIFGFIILLVLIGGGFWAWPLLAAALGLSSVTDKPGAINHIRQLMRTYDVTIAEVETAFNEPTLDIAHNAKRNSGDVAKTIFAYLGAIFIVAGVGTYIGMSWNSMGSVMRVLVTLGVGYVLLIVLISALHENKFPKLVLPLTFASVFMMTGGLFVLIDEIFPPSNEWDVAVLSVLGVMALHHAALLAIYQRTIFAFTSLIFVYGFMDMGLVILEIPNMVIAIALGASLFLVSTALEKTPHKSIIEIALFISICWMNAGLFDCMAVYVSPIWASLVTGFNIALTAYGFQKADRYPRLIALGYLVGSIMAYIGLFEIVQDSSFEIIFLAITTSTLYACVVLQSRALLLTTVVAMLSFIGYFSEKYFTDSLGWPATLVLMGVAFLGVGAIAMKVKKEI